MILNQVVLRNWITKCEKVDIFHKKLNSMILLHEQNNIKPFCVRNTQI